MPKHIKNIVKVYIVLHFCLKCSLVLLKNFCCDRTETNRYIYVYVEKEGHLLRGAYSGGGGRSGGFHQPILGNAPKIFDFKEENKGQIQTEGVGLEG